MTMVMAKPQTERKNARRPRITEEKKNRICELYNADVQIKDIAVECDVNVQTIYRTLRERRL